MLQKQSRFCTWFRTCSGVFWISKNAELDPRNPKTIDDKNNS